MGLRERKKVLTTRAIEDAALRLFAENGYRATTTTDIADAALISQRTFFAYFPTKESVLFGDFDETFRSLDEHLEQRGEQGVLDTIRGWIVALIQAQGMPDERTRARQQIIDANDELRAYERQLTTRFESIIAAAVASELGTAPDDLHARLVAGATASSLTALRPQPGAPPPDPGRDPFAALDDALAFLRGGMRALDERRAG